MQLENKTIIVTGGAGGIGAGIAQTLAEAGANVVIADINETQAAEHAQALNKAGGKADWVKLDLAKEASVVEACATVLRKHGAVWGLVNNAGLQDRQLLTEVTAEEWDRMYAVNARGPALMSREIARAMIEANAGGRIVNISSSALNGALLEGHAAYASSKAAIVGLSIATAVDLMKYKITVNTVVPGGVATIGAMNSKGTPHAGPGLRPPPLGLCEPADIAAAVLFFVLPSARKITNQVLSVDAGWPIGCCS